jgi:hypothetical protein
MVSRVATWECGSPKRQITELVELVYYNLMTMLANYALVGGLEHFLFFHMLGIVIPTDFYFFRGVETSGFMVDMSAVGWVSISQLSGWSSVCEDAGTSPLFFLCFWVGSWT